MESWATPTPCSSCASCVPGSGSQRTCTASSLPTCSTRRLQTPQQQLPPNSWRWTRLPPRVIIDHVPPSYPHPVPQVLPGRDFLQFLEFTNGSFCDPDAAPAPPPPVSPPAPAPYAAEPTADKGKEEGAALVQEAALSITWDPQWLHITRLFHPLFPSTPHTMLPPHPTAVAAVASAAAAFDLVPPVFELPMAPVIDPAANLQVRRLCCCCCLLRCL